jgi:hypothetical protein
MQEEIRTAYYEALNRSHHGHPTIIETVYTGRPGRPSVQIDPEFLHWAYSLRSTSSISRFLGVGRQTVRNALLSYGIAQEQSNPFIFYEDNRNTADSSSEPETSHADPDVLLDPPGPVLVQDAISVTDLESQQPQSHIVSYTGPISSITDDQVDNLILQLRQTFVRAGTTMLHGMLRRLGYRISYQRIRQSLLRIDPIHRVFDRIRIRRRVYSVPGPNALWHHDGQHGKHLHVILV